MIRCKNSVLLCRESVFLWSTKMYLWGRWKERLISFWPFTRGIRCRACRSGGWSCKGRCRYGKPRSCGFHYILNGSLDLRPKTSRGSLKGRQCGCPTRRPRSTPHHREEELLVSIWARAWPWPPTLWPNPQLLINWPDSYLFPLQFRLPLPIFPAPMVCTWDGLTSPILSCGQTWFSAFWSTVIRWPGPWFSILFAILPLVY